MTAPKNRLDAEITARGLTRSRSQAESYIKLGKVKVGGKVVTKPGFKVGPDEAVELADGEQYVSRAALKLASVAGQLKLDFRDKIVLDIGSSTGGFTDYALKRGAKKVIAIDIGTNQLHPTLREDPRIELHEKTDIRDFHTSEKIDVAVADLSFISLREVLPGIAALCAAKTRIAAMVKPQFEAGRGSYKHKGVIKNDSMRRDILKDFEAWARAYGFVILDKADSSVSGAKGNRERFYLMQKSQKAKA